MEAVLIHSLYGLSPNTLKIKRDPNEQCSRSEVINYGSRSSIGKSRISDPDP